MIAIRIRGQKNFMAKLLTTDTFDRYLLEEATIDTFNTFTIDGKLHREFFEGSDSDTADADNHTGESFSSWSMIRPICLELIKGKRTPLSFKFVLLLDETSKAELYAQGKDIDIQPDLVSFGIIIKFLAGEVQITTGISHKTFTMDKSAEKAWDAYIPSFLDSNGIDYEIL